jgi:hypothetical protein
MSAQSRSLQAVEAFIAADAVDDKLKQCERAPFRAPTQTKTSNSTANTATTIHALITKWWPRACSLSTSR